jgi:hypothetical protein
MYAGETFTATTGQPAQVFTFSLPGGEIERLREALRKVRPTGHDHICENGPDGPDTWVDQTEEDAMINRSGMVAVKWEQGVGFIRDDNPTPPHVPYVGWCCGAANQRHVIDEALGESTSVRSP